MFGLMCIYRSMGGGGRGNLWYSLGKHRLRGSLIDISGGSVVMPTVKGEY